MNNIKLYLASKSPRRKDLLHSLGFSFDTIENDVDESYPTNLPVNEVAAYISNKKASVYSPQQNEIFITADTVVIIDNQILGKPKNEEEAFLMLKKLNNNTHLVITAVSLITHENIETFSTETQVKFKFLQEEQLQFYIQNYKPFDKAGSYGIQEWIGLVGIEKITGSYTNVMGLPTDILYEKLMNHLVIR